MHDRGFTIVELIVVIAVIGILLVLSVVNLRSSQANGRDSERKTDAETIALHLESFFTSGEDISIAVGRYPSTVINTSTTMMKRMLRDIDTKSITAPSTTDPATTFIAANNNIQTAGGVTTAFGAITNDQYVYQPIQGDGTLCTIETQECRKFNLYYKLEIATSDCPAPNNICMITSKNQ